MEGNGKKGNSDEKETQDVMSAEAEVEEAASPVEGAVGLAPELVCTTAIERPSNGHKSMTPKEIGLVLRQIGDILESSVKNRDGNRCKRKREDRET